MPQWGVDTGTATDMYVNVYENWNGATSYSMHVRCFIVKNVSNTVYSDGAGWDGNMGGVTGSWGGTYSLGGGTNTQYTWWEFDHEYGKDANGNSTMGVYWHVNGNNGSLFGNYSISQSYSPARIALGPSIADWTADTIKPTSARLGTELNNYGNGTSAAGRIHYRIQGSGSGWSYTSDQGDGAGYNYWTVTGLKPGKTYEYYAYWWNNNGDPSQSGTRTFKTKGIAGHTPLLLRMA